MGRLSGLRVLVVDDDEDVLDAVSDVLSMVGADVVTANTLGEARAKLVWTRPQLVVSDWNLDGEYSSAFLCALAAAEPSVGRVLMTGSPCDEWEALVGAGVVQRAMIKPFEMRELIDVASWAASELGARQLMA